MDSNQINWHKLALKLETITDTENGYSEVGGTKIAETALTEILGDEFVIQAVDYYVTRSPGSELARSVLMLIKPKIAIQRCWEIFDSYIDKQQQYNALSLLRDICDISVMERIPELFSHNDHRVRMAALALVDELSVIREVMELEDAMQCCKIGLKDKHELVSLQAQQIVDSIEDLREFSENQKVL